MELVRSCVVSVLDVSPDCLTPGTALLELGAQSWDFLHLVFRLEQTFQIEMSKELAIPDSHDILTYCRAVETALADKS